MTTETPEIETQVFKGSKRKLMLLVILGLLAVAGGGWFAWKHFHHAATPIVKAESQTVKWIIVNIPTVMSNLDSGPDRVRYVRVTARLEVEDGKAAGDIPARMPQILDAFQTCLHGIRPDELSGAGIYRLRETMFAQISNILAPLQVEDLFFTEVLVQ